MNAGDGGEEGVVGGVEGGGGSGGGMLVEVLLFILFNTLKFNKMGVVICES